MKLVINVIHLASCYLLCVKYINSEKLFRRTLKPWSPLNRKHEHDIHRQKGNVTEGTRQLRMSTYLRH
jgi:hypothetical protein